MGTISKNCKLVVSVASKVCSSCTSHGKYMNRAPLKTLQVTNMNISGSGPISSKTLKQTTQEQSIIEDGAEQSTVVPSAANLLREDLLKQLQEILKGLHIPEDRAALMLESAKNEGIEKTQRRWSSR